MKKTRTRRSADEERLEWIQSQLERGNNIEFTRELADLEDGRTGLCVMVWKFTQSGPEAGCGSFVAGNTSFRCAIDDARKVLAREARKAGNGASEGARTGASERPELDAVVPPSSEL